MKKTTKRLLALLLCAVLTVGLVPAVAASVTRFPEFYEEVGVGMKAFLPWDTVAGYAQPSQTYFQEEDDWDNCMLLTELYIDLLEDTGDFEVVSPWKVVQGKEGSDLARYRCDLRYTGSAKMKGTLRTVRADQRWPDYGEYHITVEALRDASRSDASRRNSVKVVWDSALWPEGIDFYAGEDTGDRDKPDTGSTKPDTGTTTPDTGSTKPDTGTTAPDTGSTKPDTGTTTPDTGNTVGNSDNTFQSLDSAMGYYLTDFFGDGTRYDDKHKNPMSHDEMFKVAEEYVNLLVGEDNFCLAVRRKYGAGMDRQDLSWSGGKCSTWFIRYTGKAPMQENLQKGNSISWSDYGYGPYHIKVTVWVGKVSYITVDWDDGLEPVESNRRTATGAKLGSAERPPKKVTAVLMIGYNQMCVGSDVVQVDKSDAVTPVIENNRTLVPVSRIVDAFGGGSTWDAAQRVAGFTLEDRGVTHKIGTKTIQVTGAGTETRTMNAPSKLMHNRTYVPARYILEGLGLWVGYEPNYKLVVVSTEDLDGEDLVKLPESQRLFASEEVPETASKYVEHYVIDGMNYTMEVGESLTLYNSHSAISTHSAYTWDVLDGSELVKVDRGEATCRFYAKRPGTVTVKAEMLQSVQGSIFSADTFNSSETVTITIVPATGQGSAGGLMHWQTCPSCNGTGKIRSGTREITCRTCLGQKQVLLP